MSEWEEEKSCYSFLEAEAVRMNSPILPIHMAFNQSFPVTVNPGNRYSSFCPFHVGYSKRELMIYDSNTSFFCYGCKTGGRVYEYLIHSFYGLWKRMGLITNYNEDAIYDVMVNILAEAFDINISTSLKLAKQNLEIVQRIKEAYHSPEYLVYIEKSLDKTINYKRDLLIDPSMGINLWGEKGISREQGIKDYNFSVLKRLK